ncbi:hypothetical protein MYSTI_05795 [Myxococcus stipitatus DSM 14675]|uniref:Uncharacterized protein n=1 Tax=Myxococcus stipitatus (strain DSM 14675 / JCM 12634 / Mx s8) TaxID=1278073 RepID=L7UDS9_MYXSD|nr:hypothetical protein [Myxococcus stipitatus]AGC47071.1 hypothetical protein MYSTI_05795 [Myxococcus stipitatus DSM 14675]
MKTILGLMLIGMACLPGLAFAETPAPAGQDSTKVSDSLLRMRMTSELDRKKKAEGELDLLKRELPKAQGSLNQIKTQQLDAAQLPSAIAAFNQDFAKVLEVVKKGGTPSSSDYRLIEQRIGDLFTWGLIRAEDFLPRRNLRPETPALLQEIYLEVDRSEDPPSWGRVRPLTFLQSAIRQSYSGPPTGGRASDDPVKAALLSAETLAAEVAPKLFDDLLKQDKAMAEGIWQALINRVQSASTDRQREMDAAGEAITAIDKELLVREAKKTEVDSNLTLAIYGMVFVLFAIYLATRWFSPEIQTIIFQQRTLVEMIGLAFLLLTIIILGTGQKIDPAVLGTLLGTVGGYIFGQQIQSRRNASASDAPQPPAPPEPKAALTQRQLEDMVDALKRMAWQGVGVSPPPGGQGTQVPASDAAPAAGTAKPPAPPG